ncbi:MAG: patatin [Gemmatimonadetes bacterium]|nr:patatin [Gemmatimonadota bacterium]
MADESGVPRIGIALGGGAARGWAHIGVLRALGERGIEPQLVCGASIGSLVGGIWALGSLAGLEEWVCQLSNRQVLRLLDITVSGGGAIGGRRLMDVFRENFGDPLIENLPRRYAAVACDLRTGAEVWLQQGSLATAIRASISLPAVFTPVFLNGRWLADGSLVNPVPVNLCRALGAEIVIAVDLNCNRMTRPRKAPLPEPEPEPAEAHEHGWRQGLSSLWRGRHERASEQEPEPAPEPAPPGFRHVLATALDIMQDRIGRSRLAGDPPDLLIAPWLGEVEPLEFTGGQASIAEGYRSVQRLLPSLEYLLGLKRPE